jgi:hypothetical protein
MEVKKVLVLTPLPILTYSGNRLQITDYLDLQWQAPPSLLDQLAQAD